MGVPARYSRVTTAPTHLEPTPCQGSTVECFFTALAIVAVVPLALWVLPDPVLAAAVGASITVTAVTLVGLLPRDEPLFERDT